MLESKVGPYVIAEVGQNHNGSEAIARELVRMAADPRPQEQLEAEALPLVRADAVKLTRRKLSRELSREQWEAEYIGTHSYGPTYGEHRKALELSWPSYTRLSDHARQLGADFGVTVCHPDLVRGALESCTALAFLKVASRDIRNDPLLEELAASAPKVAKVVSLGMAEEGDLDRVLRIFRNQLETLTLMHCRSVYPTPPRIWDLQVIPELRHRLEGTGVQVGYSDHSVGNAACIAATAMGAQVLEKHITLDRRMAGGDHLGSVDRGGLYRLLRDLTAVALGTSGPMGVRVPPETRPAQEKLERSLAWASSLNPGTVVEERHLALLSPGTGLPWHARDQLLGKKTVRHAERHTLCDPQDVA